MDEFNQRLDECRTREERQQFLLNMICFASCIEGLFFFGAFAYVYYLRSRGLLPSALFERDETGQRLHHRLHRRLGT